jgi:carboxyl-terminal processing protease
MRRTLVVLILLVISLPLKAAPVTSSRKPAGPPLASKEAHAYAQQLLFAINEVAQQYVRPVSRQALTAAAISGLYESARLPVPRDLAIELDKLDLPAMDVGTMVMLGSPPGHGPILSAAILCSRIGDAELLDYLVQRRMELGDLEPLRGNNALMVSMQTMLRSLDPYSMVINGEELRRTNTDQIDQSFGLELVPTSENGPTLVQTVAPGGPAQRAGIRPGDHIPTINGKPAAQVWAELQLRDPSTNMPMSARLNRLDIVVVRGNSKVERKVKLVSEAFKAETVLGVNRRDDNSWNYFLDQKHKIAQVRIGPLTKGTSEDLRGVLNQLQNDGMRGLILDLRWCPGGFLNEAVNIAKLFLKEGVVATIASRVKQEEYAVTSSDAFLQFPVVVLVNGETSGGGELIAAALQDYHRGIIAGQRSLGKGSVQYTLPLPIGNAGMKLTTGRFLRPSGKNLNRFPDSKPSDDWGVRPDAGQELPLTADLARQLKDWWLWQTLRPGSNTEALPLDDPEVDPQRQAALRYLRDKMGKLGD